MLILAAVGVFFIGSTIGYTIAVIVDTIHIRILRRRDERTLIWNELNK